MWETQCHKPSRKITIFMGGMFTIRFVGRSFFWGLPTLIRRLIMCRDMLYRYILSGLPWNKFPGKFLL